MSIKTNQSFRFLLFAILSLIGIVFTFLPDQTKSTETHAEWVLSSSSDDLQSAQKEQLKIAFWKTGLRTSQASFSLFYSPDINNSARQTLRYLAQPNPPHFFQKYFSFSHRSIYSFSDDESPYLKFG